MASCRGCGGANQPGKRFCRHCGTRLPASCPACGAGVDPGQRFCDECGAALVAGAVASEGQRAGEGGLPPRPATGPTVDERRLVSVLFADLVGFTRLSEARDPEEVRELLSSYFEVCRGVVGRYGGTVEKFIGDAVLAVWGAPIAHEDDAERSVRCAIELVAAVALLGGRVGAPGLSARAGVLSGEAAISLHASGEGMIAGDIVNTASRLQTAAEPGSVLVGESTYLSARHAVAFAELGELTLKGKEGTVRAWRALRVVAQRRGIGRSEGTEAPFVGRDEELRALKEALHALARERRARLVSVIGVPGIGKSRLAWEFLKYVDGLAEDVYWHQGRSPSYGEGVSFWALSEMVRLRAAIAEDDAPDLAREKLAQALAEFVADPDERAWIEARLAYLLGLGEAPPGQREETFSAWRGFFEHVAASGPLVMVFEDLQWADLGLIDFVESILEWSRAHPILIVTLARPELLDRRPSWGAGQRSFVSVHLDPLPAPLMRTLLEGVVRDIPERLSAQILERAEGVPLYAVETVRMLAAKGLVVEQGGHYRAAGELSELEVPRSLQALIASRLDGLPPEEASLLRDASVLGKTFTLEALSALRGESGEEIEGLLRHLVRKEVLGKDTDPRSPERGQYGFLQGLIREVAYGRLARRDRLAKHLAAATYLESLGDDELAGVVAAHYLEAYGASPDGAGRDALAASARSTLVEAGRRAVSLGSPEQALAYFEQAGEIAAPPAERSAVSELAGEAAELSAHHEQALAHYEQAIAYYEATGDEEAAGRVVARAAQSLATGLGRYGEAIERAGRALEAIGPDGDLQVRATLAATSSDLCRLSGQPEPAYRWAEVALAAAERLDSHQLFARGLGARAGALYDLGRHQEAVLVARATVALADEAGLLLEQARALTHLSMFALDDDPREALAASLAAAAVARRAGNRRWETMNLLNATEDAIWVGEWGEADRILAELADRELPGDWLLYRDLCRAMLSALTGDIEAASSLLLRHGEALAASEHVDNRVTNLKAQALVSLVAGALEESCEQAAAAVAADPSGINSPRALAIGARAALWLGDPGRAVPALVGMAGFHGRWTAATSRTVEAGIAALDGRREEAAAAYERALRCWRDLDAGFDLALCLLDMALLLGETPPGLAAASEARHRLALLGADPLLPRIPGGSATRAAPPVDLGPARSRPAATPQGPPQACFRQGAPG